jgi:EpsI family protein
LNPIYREKTYSVIILLFIAAACLSFHQFILDFGQRDSVDINAFPKEIGQWKSKEINITETEYQLLETRNAFSREYQNNDGGKIYLFVIYSQTNRKVFHPPEICYAGGGATIVHQSRVDLPVGADRPITANRFLIEKGDSEQMMYYWFKVGARFTPDYWAQQILVAVNFLSGQRKGSAMIRIAAPITADSQDVNSQLAQQFISDIFPSILQYLP